MLKRHANEDVQNVIGMGVRVEWSSEVRKVLWLCKVFFTPLDSVMVTAFSEEIV